MKSRLDRLGHDGGSGLLGRVLMSSAPMPKLQWTTRLGHIGEDRVSAVLSYSCLVNKHYREVGIDFHCELLENGSPSGRVFYVQAKGSQHFDETWSQSIPKSTVAYWLSQTAPVMLVVYDENAKVCYWMSIESHRYDFLPKLSSSSGTIHIMLDRSKTLTEETNANDAFIDQIKADQGSIMLWMGHPQPKGEGYIKELPPAPRSQQELARVEDNLRMNLYSLVRYCMGSYEWARARDLCEFVTKFDRSHYNQFVMLGQIQEVLGDRRAALLSWKEALGICERDKKWERESMDRIKEAIKREIGRIEASLQAGTSN
jgi:hypothetical protein